MFLCCAHINVRIHVCVPTHERVRACVRACVRSFVRSFVCACVRTCVCVCTRACGLRNDIFVSTYLSAFKNVLYIETA